jgi:hypothetical protein
MVKQNRLSNGEEASGRGSLPPSRVVMITQSLRALSLGCWAMLPFVGIICGPLALNAFRRARSLRGHDDNPAGRQAMCGGLRGVLGLMNSCAWIAGLMR